MSATALLDLLDLASDGERPAVTDATGTVTRAELLRRAACRASRIEATVPVGSRVALHDTQDIASVTNLVAALVAGRSVAMVPQETGIDLAHAAAVGCAAILSGDEVQPVPGAAEPSSFLDTRFGEERTGSREAVVLFTSGTTSEPKGVRLSEANILGNLTAVSHVAPPWTASARFGMVLALTHSFGLSMVLLSLARRTPISLLGGGVPSRAMVDRFEDEKVTVLACVPYYLRLLERRHLRMGLDVGTCVDTVLLAGGGVTDRDLERLLPGFTGDLLIMYGFTEATARVAVRLAGDGSPADSVGLPLPGSSVEIVSPEGVPLPVGSEGRIRVTSPSLMMGYLGDDLRAPGPFTTTDLGRLDHGGNLVVTGREAEMLNFRGNRVSVVAVESTVMKLDGVVDARVVPDGRDEDAQCALHLVLDPSADPRSVRREAMRVVQPRGLLREVVFTDRLETTRSGKPLRRI